MSEAPAADKALLGIVAIEEAIDRPQEGRGILGLGIVCKAGRRRLFGRAGDPAFGERVGARPFRDRLRGVAGVLAGQEPLMAGERGEHVRRRMGVVAGLRQVADAEIVRFIFLAARIAVAEILGGAAGKPGELLRSGQAHGEDAERVQERALLASPGVAGGDVADFVREHGCEFRLAGHQPHQAAGEVDVAAGHRKGVHHIAVDQSEGAVAGEAGRPRHPLADPGEVARLRAVIAAAEFGEQRLMLAGAQLPVGSADLRRAGRALAAAAGEQQSEGRERGEDRVAGHGLVRR